MVTLKGSRFILRPFKKGDEKSLQKAINDKEIAKNTATIPYPYTMKDAKFWVRDSIEQARKKPLTNLRFVIEINKEVTGSVGFHHIEGHQAEIGYWLARKYWGQGIMPEAVKLVTKYGFEKMKLRRIYGGVFLFNDKSARVLEKAGFVYEGTAHKSLMKNGKLVDERMFALVN